MRKLTRTVAGVLASSALVLSLSSTPVHDHQDSSTLSSEWIEGKGTVTYTDNGGCFCSLTGKSKCSVLYDRKNRNVGSCDDADHVCGKFTGCPH